jgi:nucleotide-binding universal stress UspA family protein
MHLPGSDPRHTASTIPTDPSGPAGSDAVSIRTILLATDLSPASAVAEDLAFELATRLDGTLLLVSVIDPQRLSLASGGYGERIDQARETRQTAAQGIVERGRKGGMAVRTLIWEGDPGEAIIEAAIAENVDLVVVGSHQRRGVDRLVMGSVSEQVVRSSPVPVVVARRAPR